MQIAQALREIGRDELGQEVDRIFVQVRRILDLAPENIFIDLDRRAAVPKWSEPAQHLKNQDSQ